MDSWPRMSATAEVREPGPKTDAQTAVCLRGLCALQALPDLGAKRAKRQVADQPQERGVGKAPKLQRSPSCTFKRGMLRVLTTRAGETSGETSGFCSTINEGSCPYVQTRVAPEDIVDHVEEPPAARPSAPAESRRDTGAACSAPPPADPCVDSSARLAQRARLEAQKAQLELKLAELLLSQQQRAASAVPTIARTEAMVPATGDWMNFVAGSSSEDEDVTELPPQRRLGACLPRTGSYHRLDRHERQTDAKSGYVQRLKNEKVVTSPARRKVETSTDRRKVETSNDRRPCQRNLEARAKPHHSSVHASRRDSHDIQDCVTLLHDMRLQRPKTAGVNNHVSGCDSGRVMRSAFRSRQGEQNPAVDEEGIFAWVMPPS